MQANTSAHSKNFGDVLCNTDLTSWKYPSDVRGLDYLNIIKKYKTCCLQFHCLFHPSEFARFFSLKPARASYNKWMKIHYLIISFNVTCLLFFLLIRQLNQQKWRLIGIIPKFFILLRCNKWDSAAFLRPFLKACFLGG